MADPKRLRLGVESPFPSMHEEESRVATLQATIEHYLPDFVKAVENTSDSCDDESVLILHQDAIAAGYNDGD